MDVSWLDWNQRFWFFDTDLAVKFIPLWWAWTRYLKIGMTLSISGRS